jgi:hypothetical protein
MRKHLILITSLATVKLVIQLLGNHNYGFHRDELLHLSVGQHLDWGYMEFPPLIGWLGRLSTTLFDTSLMGMRLFPTLAGVAILVVCCLAAKKWGGSWKAILVAGACVLGFLPFYRNHTLFQPVAFDQLCWTLGFYYLVCYLKDENNRYLYLTGLVTGIGLLNKYTMLVWAFAAVVGLLFFDGGRTFRKGQAYLAAGIALLVFLPNVLWQASRDFPLFGHLEELRESQLSEMAPWDFGLAQLEYPFTLIISLLGVWFLLKSTRYRTIGVAAVVLFATMWILRAKAYYVFGVYPILFAAGAVQVDHWLRSQHPAGMIGVAAVVFLPTVPFIPEATPVLPIEDYVAYKDLPRENGRVELRGDYADMFGWKEQVALVDSVYRALSPTEQKNCVLWAENYGEAGALTILGDRYGLPDPISRHGTFWTWGYQNPDADVWISLGNEEGSVNHVFADVRLVKMIYHPYAIGEENGIPLYVCRQPKVDIPQWWADYEPYIFD